MIHAALCCECYTSVPLAYAVAKLPCPSCVGRNFSYFVGSTPQDNMLEEVERRMRIGRWADARFIISSCSEWGAIDASDCDMIINHIQLRKLCTSATIRLLHNEGGFVPTVYVRKKLITDHDEQTISWVLNDYYKIEIDRVNKICFMKE